MSLSALEPLKPAPLPTKSVRVRTSARWAGIKDTAWPRWSRPARGSVLDDAVAAEVYARWIERLRE